MLILRPEQLEAFWPVMEAAYAEEITGYLREAHPGARVRVLDRRCTLAEVSDEILYEMVRGGVARAHEYGFKAETTIREFVVLMVTAAPNFDEYPPIQDILSDTTLPIDCRLQQLQERISQKEWARVKQHYDASAWNVKPRED
jgi:hypothetical protein